MRDWTSVNYSIIAFRRSLLESVSSFEEQKALTTNEVLRLANMEAHNGASKREIQNFMFDQHNVGPYEIAHAWYRAGNGASTHVLNHFVGH